MAGTGSVDHYKGYRIFLTKSKKANYLRVQYIIQKGTINPYLPRKFKWTVPGDINLLHTYIDALLFKNFHVTDPMETKGLAIELEYLSEIPAQTVRISPTFLLAILRGECPLCIPQNENIILKVNTDRYAPTQFSLDLAAEDLTPCYHEAIKSRVEQHKHLRVEKGLEVTKKKGSAALYDINFKATSANIELADEQHGPCVYENEDYKATLIGKEDRGDCIVVKTYEELPDGDFYCRRYYLSAHQEICYRMETSWDNEAWETVFMLQEEEAA